jgi:hypothetical protein
LTAFSETLAMASKKKRRKASSMARKALQGGLVPRHPDGDRRRRGSADEAVAAKARARRWTIDAAGQDVLMPQPPSPAEPDRD